MSVPRSFRHPRNGIRPLALVAVGVLAVTAMTTMTACSDDDATTATDGTTSASSSTVGSSATPSDPTTPGANTLATDVAGIDPMDDAGLDPVSAASVDDGVALLTDVAVARQEGYDRVVFTFEEDLPGYEVGYVDPPILSDGAGEPVAVDGSYFLQVRMEPASGVDLSGETYRETYTGTDHVDTNTPEVTEVVRVGDFEAVATWVIGTRDQVAFRVTTLSDPPRLVVDLANH